MYIEVKDGSKEALDNALKEFKKKVKSEGILQDLRKHEFYVKPSQKSKYKHAEALKQMRRDERERNEKKRTSKNNS